MTLPTKNFDATISKIGIASEHLDHMDETVIVDVVYESVAEAEVSEYSSHFNKSLSGEVVDVFRVDIGTVSVRLKLEQKYALFP